MSEKRQVRMSIPRSEEDVDRLVQEVHGEEEGHTHETHEHGEHLEAREEAADVPSLLAGAVHMLSHLDGHLSELASSIKSLDGRLQNIERLLGVLARILLLPEVKKQELRERLVREIVESLEG